MADSPSGGDSRLRDLEAAVARLSARLDVLEGGQHIAAPAAAPAPPPAALPALAQTPIDAPPADHLPPAGTAADATAGPVPRSAVAAEAADATASGWLGLIGRTFIVLGGAFLLRALTNSGQLPMAGGVWIGLAYATLWLALATRAAGPSSFFHGLSALLVGLPIVVEAVLGFRVMSGGVGALMLAAGGVAALGIAGYRRQRTLAMIATLGTLATTFVLAIGLSQMPPPVTVLPPVLTLLAIGTAALWVSYGPGLGLAALAGRGRRESRRDPAGHSRQRGPAQGRAVSGSNRARAAHRSRTSARSSFASCCTSARCACSKSCRRPRCSCWGSAAPR